MKLEPGSKLARYSLLEQLGQGGMGVVWKALDTTLDREIAIKVLAAERVGDERWLARFAHEARVVAALNHPNIVTIHSVETVDGIRFFTMELVRGRRLSQMIPLDGFALPELLDLAIPLAEAVAVAHARGIVHGDLKPGNVMVTEDGRVKVLDFGLARVEIKSPAGSISEISTQPFRSEGGISGTLPYMSPEQIRGDTIDQRSDIFSLGIMLHELSIGRRPFEGDTGMALAAAILRDDPPSLTGLRPEMPLHLGWLIGRCLAKEPRQRIQSARHLAEELEALKVGALAVGPDQPTIAVLPFVDLSAERDQEYFCEGLADETINALMRIEHLHVCSRGSSFQFKGMAMGAREVGRRLGVRTLLEGSVRKAGDRLRITAQLTSVADGYCLWSERFDRRLEDIFSIQEEIARSIVDALGVTLTPQERRNVGRVATSNVNAYDFYLRGRRFLNQYTRRGIEFARQMFTRAIEIDPGFAPGHAGLADCASYLFMYVKRDGRLLGEAEMASRRALEIDPELAHAHASLAVVLSLFRRAEEAESEFRKAIELGPRLFEAYFYYARECTLEGRFEEAARLYERAGQLQPEDCQAALLAVGAYERLGRTAEAQALRRRGANIAMERLRRNPDDIRSMYLAANALVMLGERERGLELAEKAVELGEDDAMLHYNVGCIFALAENADRALDCLEHAARVGNIQVSWYRHDSDLDSLRKLPRFQQLMEWLDAIQNEPASGD